MDNQFSNWSSLQSVRTSGCNDAYCAAYALKSDGYIQNFSFGDLAYSSGNDGGWGLHLAYRFIAQIGREMAFSITPVRTISISEIDAYSRVYYTIFIDYNRDRDFSDPGEEVFRDEGGADKVYSWKIPIPAQTSSGPTRMRVIMSRKTLGKACEQSNNILEVEDYTLDIFQPCPAPSLQDVSISHLSSGSATLSVKGAAPEYQWRYRPVSGGNWITLIPTTSPQGQFNGLAQNSEYEAQVRSSCGGGNWSLFSSSYVFKTAICTIGLNEKIAVYRREKDVVGLNFSFTSAVGYEWRYREDSVFQWLDTLYSTTPSMLITGLKAGRNYVLQIRAACSPGNWSDWRGYMFFTWGECTAIAAEQLSLGFDLNFRGNFIILTSKMQSASVFYWRTRRKGTNAWTEGVTDSPYNYWYTSNSPPEVVYEWQVAFQCQNGKKSDWSVIREFAMPPAVCAPASSKRVILKQLGSASATLSADIPYGVHYRWRWREKGDVLWRSSPGAYAMREIKLLSLKPDTEYEYSFSYWCIKGMQDWSDAGSFRTFSAPGAQLKDSTRTILSNPPRVPAVGISPNPNGGTFKVESFLDQPGPVLLLLRDLHGNMVFQREIQNQQWINEYIEVEWAPKGLYLLEIRGSSFSKTEKVILH